MSAEGGKKTAIVLFSHGTVENLEDLPGFVTNIRRGHAPPREVVEELERRYRAIGGRSPLGDITRALAAKVEARTSLPTRMAMRMWHPFPEEVLRELVKEGVERVLVIPLAQHSTAAYAQSMLKARESVLGADRAGALEVRCAKNWGSSPRLVSAFAATIDEALAALPEEIRARTALVMTAHSVPASVVRAGDPYERDAHASNQAIYAALRRPNEVPLYEAFQSQGMGGGEWIGPDLPTTLDAAAAAGKTHVLFAPVGFLSDHVEVLYDLDIEAKELARARGMTTSRSASLNDSPMFVEALAALVEELAS